MQLTPGPAYRIAFSTRFPTTTWSIRARNGRSNEAVHSTLSSTPAAAARSAASETTWSITGKRPDRAERHHRAPALELAEEEHVVDQLADPLDLDLGPSDQVVLVGAR